MNIAVCSGLRFMLLYGYHAPLWVSCSFMGIMLRNIDVLSYGLSPRVFRPNLGRWAGVVVSGNTAGTQFRQCTTEKTFSARHFPAD